MCWISVFCQEEDDADVEEDPDIEPEEEPRDAEPEADIEPDDTGETWLI